MIQGKRLILEQEENGSKTGLSRDTSQTLR
jgi:hypothetical protein